MMADLLRVVLGLSIPSLVSPIFECLKVCCEHHEAENLIEIYKLMCI